MPDTSRERTGEFVQNLFKLLISNPDGLQARDAIEQLAKTVKLTPYEAGEYKSSGTRRFDKIVRFATVDCAKAGWLQKQNGTWTITESGIEAYKKFSAPGDLYREATRLYRTWKSTQSAETAGMSDAEFEEPSDKKTAVTFEEAGEQALGEIRQHLSQMPPFEFQNLVAALVRAMGYHVSWEAAPGKDGGIDIFAHPDALGTMSPRIKVQVKRTADKTNTDTVRAFSALIKEGDVGLFVALGGFTRDAKDFARNQERTKVTLVNLDEFHKLWIANYAKLDDTARKRLPLSPIYFLTSVG